MATNNAVNIASAGIVTYSGSGSFSGSTVTQHGVLLGGASNAVSSLGVASTGTVLAGSTGADPAFTATPAVTSISFGGSSLATYSAAQSWTPVVAFGGSSTGVTYTTQSGTYTQIGNVVFFNCLVILSSKGAQVGTATLGGFPASPVGNTTICVPRFDNITFTGTSLCVEAIGTSATLTFINSTTATTATILNNTNFSNTSEFAITGSFFAS